MFKHAHIDCCLNCEKRTVKCHSTCSIYKQQKKEHEEYLATERKRIENDYLYFSRLFRAESDKNKWRW